MGDGAIRTARTLAFTLGLLLAIHILFGILQPATNDGLNDKLPKREMNMTEQKSGESNGTTLSFERDRAGGESTIAINQSKIPLNSTPLANPSSSDKDRAHAASTTAINQAQISPPSKTLANASSTNKDGVVASTAANNQIIIPPAGTSTLVIVQGNLRGGEIAWRTLKERVLDNNPNTDLALMIGDPVDPRYANSSLFGWAKYTWTFPEYEDWGVALDETFGTEWRQTIRAPLANKTNPDHVLGNVLGGINGTRFGSGAVQFMIRYWLHQKIQELNLVEQYTQFVITRSDHYYLCSQNLSNYDTHEFLYVPRGEDWGGINDRHLVVGKEHVLAALDWFPHVLKHTSVYRLQGANTELMLWTFWRSIGLRVKRNPREMFCSINPDLDDQTRTGMGANRLAPEGVRIKYDAEYALAKKDCGVER